MSVGVRRDAATFNQEQDEVRTALTELFTNVPRDVEEVVGPFLRWCRDHIEEIEAIAFGELLRESVGARA
jgi:hypothetical protein